MPEWIVTVERTRIDKYEFYVEADTKSSAECMAERQAERNEGLVHWYSKEVAFQAKECEEQVEFDGNGDATV
jgi:hypothetical protein